MNHVQLEHHHHCRPNFLFQPVKLKAVALEHQFAPRRVRYPLEDRLHLSGVETSLGHQDVKGYGEEPEGGDVELAGLRCVSWKLRTQSKS